MDNDIQNFFKEFTKSSQKIGRDIPDVAKQFAGLVEKSLQPGALDTKQKELIALGIAVAQHCPPCIYIHTQKAVEAGASRQEIMEAAGVAILMGGGPAYAHVPEVIKVLETLGVT